LSQIGLPATHHAQKRTKFHMAVKPPLIVACQDCLQPAGFAMRQLFMLAVALLVVGGYVAFYADRAVGTRPESQAAVVQPANEPREPTSSGRSLMLESDRQGHFQVEARVEGRFVDFVVDTGASLVVLRETTAAQVGIRLQPRDYTATAVTANGKIMAARATIERIEVGGIAVYDVPAMVLPDEALAKNLLGVSFLSRLKRYEYANGRMVLEQ
jgi:aspartyl protease family protein